jgi:hypothetical protein
MIGEADPYWLGDEELLEIQRQSMAERFRERRAQIKVLDQRASDLGIDSLESFEDVIPLLFAHQTYKSYPDAFVSGGRWDLLTRWLDTLTPRDVSGISMDGVGDVDAWVARLGEHGHQVVVSSGTTGKASFLYRTAEDREVMDGNMIRGMCLTMGLTADNTLPVFLLGPKTGNYVFVYMLQACAERFGRPGAVHWLLDESVSEVAMQRQAMLKKRAEDGTATPNEIRELQDGARERQEQMRVAVAELADVMIATRSDPSIIAGLWLPQYLMMEEFHRRGLGDGGFHPKTGMLVGGGNKGNLLPEGYEKDVARFYGLPPDRWHRMYGMVEMSSTFYYCEAGRYHRPPWVTMLVLDREGERLLNPTEGPVSGRMAFFDHALEGRWGGLISGDRIEADFSTCPCGRRSPQITSISRYSDLPEGDDKLSCAGTMAAYVRGVIQE